MIMHSATDMTCGAISCRTLAIARSLRWSALASVMKANSSSVNASSFDSSLKTLPIILCSLLPGDDVPYLSAPSALRKEVMFVWWGGFTAPPHKHNLFAKRWRCAKNLCCETTYVVKNLCCETTYVVKNLRCETTYVAKNLCCETTYVAKNLCCETIYVVKNLRC